MSLKKKQKIYLINCSYNGLYKIGISVSPEKRIKQLQTASPYKLSIAAVYECKYRARKVENILHNTLSSKKVPDNFEYDFTLLEGEWFNLTSKDVLGFSESCKKIEDTIEKLKLAGNPFI
jgi:hypothetical protein